jgi:hypothetical protein
MANVGQALTHQMVAREAAKMLWEENTVVRNINTDRETEFGAEVQGYNKGETVRVAVPPTPVTFTGSLFAGGSAAPGVNESFVNLTVDQQIHVPLTFTAKEKKLELTRFRDRFLRPAMSSLNSRINQVLLSSMVAQTPNVVGTWGTIPATRTPWRNAASMLDRYLAPEDERFAHFSVDASDALAEANATLFHTADELRGEFSKNAVGMFAGLEFHKQLSLPVHTNGDGTGFVTNGVDQAGASIAIDTGTGTITAGSIVTFEGVNAVHPITGEDTGRLAQFTVTADRAGAGAMAIFPALVPTTATLIGNVTAAVADGSDVTVFGDISETETQNLVFHKDAFASAFVPLPVLASCEGYTAKVGNIAVRVMTFGNGLTDQENTRVDVLFALPAPIRPYHSCRVTE